METKESLRKPFIGIQWSLLGLIVATFFFSFAGPGLQSAFSQASGDSTALYFSGPSVDRGFQTSLRVKNLEDRELNLEIFLFDEEGISLGTIPGLESLKPQEVKTIGPEMIWPHVRGVVVQADGQVEGMALVETKDGTRSEVISMARQGAQQMDFPALVTGDLYAKTLFLFNVGENPSGVVLVALDKDGFEIANFPLPSLSSMESRTLFIQDLFSHKTLEGMTTLRIVSEGELVGYQLVDEGSKDLVGLPALTGTSKDWIVPIIERYESLELWTAAEIYNPGGSLASVEVVSLDGSGNFLVTIAQETVLPGTVYLLETANLGGAIPEGTSFLGVSSDASVFGYGVVGVANGQGLAAFIGARGEEASTAGFDVADTKDGSSLTVYPLSSVSDGRILSLAESLRHGESWEKAIVPPVEPSPLTGQSAPEDPFRGSGFTGSTVVGETGLWTGAATVSIPIEVPAGPGGLTPVLSLSYSSDAVNDVKYKDAGTPNDKHNVQASPFGYGWELGGLPSIVRVSAQAAFNDICWGYEVQLGGKRFRLAHRGTSTVGKSRITQYESYPEGFIKAYEIESYNESNPPDKGNCQNFLWHTEHRWVIKTADGTKYVFGGLRTGPEGTSIQEVQALSRIVEQGYQCHYVCSTVCGFVNGQYTCNYVCSNQCGWEPVATDRWYNLAIRWYPSHIRDTHGNEIAFNYRREWAKDLTANKNGTAYYTTAVTIDTIWYGLRDPNAEDDLTENFKTADANFYDTNATFRMRFLAETSKRPDCIVLKPDGKAVPCNGDQTGSDAPVFRSEYRMDQIVVEAKDAGRNWTELRTYDLDYGLTGVAGTDSAHSLLISVKVTRTKPAPAVSLPGYRMAYEGQGGAFTNWAPLKALENGYGGKTTFDYSPPFTFTVVKGPSRTRQRVTARQVFNQVYDNGTLRDALVSRTDYAYTSNGVDTALGSAAFSTHYVGSGTSEWYEFLGHGLVSETLNEPTPGGGMRTVAVTLTTFMQGSPTPHPSRGAILTRTQYAGGTMLHQTENTLSIQSLAYGPTNVQWGRLERTTERWGGGASRVTVFVYDPNGQCEPYQSTSLCAQYGNVTGVIEYASEAEYNASRPYRSTYKNYRTNTSLWIVNRPILEQVYDPGANEIARTGYFYDRTTQDLGGALRTWGEMPIRGDLVAVHRANPVGGGDPQAMTQSWFDIYGNRIKEADPNGNPTVTDYEGIWHTLPWQQTNAKGHVVQWFYYGLNAGTLPSDGHGFLGKLERERDVSNAVDKASYHYDVFGRPTKLIRPGDTTDSPTEVRAYYDYNGHLLFPPFPTMEASWHKREVSARPWGTGGLFERRFYDGLGRLVQVQTPYQNWNGGGAGQNDIIRYTSYDARGLKILESAPYLISAYPRGPQTGCGASGQPSCSPYKVPDLSKPVTRTTYDGLGRILTQLSPDNTRVEHHYGIDGSLCYDDVIDANRHRKQYRYDTFNRLAEVHEIDGDCSIGYWPEYACGGSFSTSWAVSSVTRYTYDFFDHLTGVCEPKKPGETCSVNDVVILYNHLGRKVSMKDPDLGTWTYDYDRAGNLIRQTDAKSQTDANKQRICLYYDSLNRLKGKTYSTGIDACPADPEYAGYAVKFFYDEPGYGASIGRRTHTETTGVEAVKIFYNYDTRGRLIKETFGVPGLPTTAPYYTSYDYYANDQVKTETYSPDGESITTSYNAQGLPASLSSNIPFGTGSSFFVTGTTYNATGQIKTMQLGNSFVTRYGYFGYNGFGLGDGDDYPEATGSAHWFGRLARICTAGNGTCLPWSQMQMSSTTALQDLSYSYDAGGNVAAIRDYPDQNRLHFYQYDAFDRLKRAYTSDPLGLNLTWDYDIAGNITRFNGPMTLTYQDPVHRHAVTHKNGIQYYWYDGNGNMTARSNGSVTAQLQYDPENRLVKVTGNGSDVSFLYDADGRLVKRTEGTGTAAAVTIYLGKNHEKKITGTQVKTVKYYALAGKRVAMREVGSGQANYYYLFTDHLGSTSVVYGTAGSISARRYFPWGDIRSGASLPTDRTFTGQRLDSSLGLYDYGARYYDPSIGRFIQPDTIVPNARNPQDWNRYAYTRNSPLRYIDPSGHYAIDPSSYIYRGEDFHPPTGPIGVPPRWPAAPQISAKPHPSFLFVEGTGGSISAPMGDASGVAHYKTYQARNLQQFKPIPVDLLTNINPGLALTAIWDTGAILQKYDLRGSHLYAHSAGTWSAIPAGILGGAQSVDVYGTPLILPLNTSIKVPLANTVINFHTRHNDPAGYSAPLFNPLLAPLRWWSLLGIPAAAIDSYRDYHNFAAGHDYLLNPAPVR